MYAKYAELRDKKQLTDYRVAIDTGIPQSTLSDWKNGKYTPKIDKLIKIAKYLGTTVEELYGESVMQQA